ncbi:helix-turn-helix transcriptional regulator [Corynebacterium sp. P5848]|uniref:helix-turn-helix domain-containing protein n=1 Tax=Corynebacterium marambiense TaxID=2765364 RepID=UPI002260F241|nr:helix-turn-helix transcriptional regulator [Corynebacterium marambiense]MCX7542329.1 helix-turn-helix transcriptional regulator [Corynebacterium marambiense]
MTHKVEIRIREGLLERLRMNSGIKNDEAFAAAIGTSRATLFAVREERREPSLAFAVGVARAFGLGLSEVVEWKEVETESVAA